MSELYESDFIEYEEAKAEYEYKLAEFKNSMDSESLKIWNFIFNRSRDVQILAYFSMDEDYRIALAN